MNFLEKSQQRWFSILQAVSRFWYSTIAFLLATGTILIAIQQENSYERLIFTLMLAGLLGIVSQLGYEVFFKGQSSHQLILYGLTTVFASGYFFYLRTHDFTNYLVGIRSAVLIFILVIAMIWLPADWKDPLGFSRSFIIFLKAFFTSLLYAIVLSLGFLALIFAFNFLITSINYKVYSSIFAMIWAGFFPLYYMSLVPHYPDEQSETTDYIQRATVPKFLEVLLTFIIIPLFFAYTFILVLYILQNLSGDFWSNNLLEPLLVSYVIVGWFTLFAIDSLDSKLVNLFKKYFPILLLFVTGLQGVASLIKIMKTGLTDGRYFILLFVLFSISSSLIYLLKHAKMIWIPALLIVLSILSILPYINAVSLATYQQQQQMVQTLNRNQMLVDDNVLPNPDISLIDKQRLVESYDYLDKVDVLTQMNFLDTSAGGTQYFITTFGFDPYTFRSPDESPDNWQVASFQLSMDSTEVVQLNVTDADVLLPLYVNQGEFSQFQTDQVSFTFADQSYQLKWQETPSKSEDTETSSDSLKLILDDAAGSTLASFDLAFLKDLLPLTTTYESTVWPLSELTFTQEFEQVRLTLFVTSLYVEEDTFTQADFYLAIDFSKDTPVN